MHPGPCFKRNWESISRTTFTQTPWIWLVVSIIEWFNTFLTLPFAHLCRICHFEESWSQFNKPFGVYDCYLAHIFLSCHYKLVVYDPVWLHLEQRLTWMNIYRLILNKGSVTFLGGSFLAARKKNPAVIAFLILEKFFPALTISNLYLKINVDELEYNLI